MAATDEDATNVLEMGVREACRGRAHRRKAHAAESLLRPREIRGLGHPPWTGIGHEKNRLFLVSGVGKQRGDPRLGKIQKAGCHPVRQVARRGTAG